ncbi:helix-turn-helix transcriptional regulator [Rugosimonospora acidiphila]|uniref:Helix-turn-helix transcriptional regulator n=1 Tax=Rugosimonospora acidiphila TaxID=556531 RepID=A0ABP9RTX3_9ACTN
MDVKGHLDLLLLATLARTGPAHGYAVIAALREHSRGSFDLPEGTVYPALHRLEQAGLIASQWDESAPRRRRVYALTVDGRRARASKQRELQTFFEAVQAVIGYRRQGVKA